MVQFGEIILSVCRPLCIMASAETALANVDHGGARAMLYEEFRRRLEDDFKVGRRSEVGFT